MRFTNKKKREKIKQGKWGTGENRLQTNIWDQTKQKRETFSVKNLTKGTREKNIQINEDIFFNLIFNVLCKCQTRELFSCYLFNL